MNDSHKDYFQTKYKTLICSILHDLVCGDLQSKTIFHEEGGSVKLMSLISTAVENRKLGYDFKKETSLLKAALRLLVAVTASTRKIKTDILHQKGLSTCLAVINEASGGSDPANKLVIMALYAVRNISDQGLVFSSTYYSLKLSIR